MPTISHVGSARREDAVTNTNFAELLPTPGEIFSTSAASTLTAIFTGEARVDQPGQELQVRVRVDDKEANPGPVTLTTSNAYSTHTYMAFLSVPAGQHKVTLECRVPGGNHKGYFRNRTFLVLSD